MSNQRPTTPEGNRNFASQASKSKAQEKQDNNKANLEKNKQRANNAKWKKKDTNYIEQTSSAGKAFIDKFFHGFSSVKRANVTSDMDDTLPFRMTEVYQDSIVSYAEATTYEHFSTLATNLYTGLLGGVSLGLAIKLNKSATEIERKSNFLLSAMSSVKIKLPKKMSIIIDQMGKTDLPNDNHFRLNNQNYAAKRHLIRGLFFTLGKDMLQEYLVNSDNYTIDDLVKNLQNNDLFTNMVDSSNWSLERIKEIGRKSFSTKGDENIEFWEDHEKKFSFRIPKFTFKEDTTVNEVGNWIKNGVFKMFKFSEDDMVKMCSGLILQLTKMTWLRNPTKKMKELDSVFAGSFFAEVTFQTIMDHCDIWNINYFLSDRDINDLAVSAVHKWNSGISKHFDKFLEIGEIEFSEYGTDAQLVQVESKAVSSKMDQIFEYVTYKIRGKAKSTTPLKMSNNNAMLGLIAKYTNNVEFSSDFELNHDKNNREILYQFVKNDFKN